MSTPQLTPGTVVDGKFTLGAAVRTRAGTTTYDATDATGAAVEVTIFDGSCFASGLALERSLRELRQLKNVSSPRVLRVHAAGKHGDGIFEVSDAAPGPTLAEQLGGAQLPLADAAALIVQIGEALLEAQRVGVIHRNLGADVVFPSPQGVRVCGFAVGEPQARGAGALCTIAPEQVQGKVVDQRTLIYNVAALMQWMLSGAPLFSGDAEAVLTAHEQQMPSEDIDPKLRRALGKDPRMRPMMLKQFLHDIAQMGGVEPPKLAARVSAPSVGTPRAPIAAPKAEAPAAARPSSRGWTMFMKAQDDEPEPETKPAAPAAAEAAQKPSTRGWTMFMQAQDDDAPADAPAEGAAEAAKPAAAAEAKPAAAPAAGDPAKPSTRGWTMFMQAEGGEASGDAPAEAAAPEADAPDPAKPSTRGWTMFTKEEEAEAAAADAAADGSTEAPAEAADVPDPAKPSTRGWTMFTKEEEDDAPQPAAASAAEQVTTPVTPASDAPAAPTEEAGSGPSKSPSSRGWTMFMEPGASGEAGAAPSADAPSGDAPAPEPPPSDAVEAPAAEAEDAPGPGEAAPAGKKRGWTMFMDAPIADLPKKKEAPSEPEQPTAPAVDGASDKKGWTVFGAPALSPQERAAAAASLQGSSEDPAADAPDAMPPGPSSRGQTVVVGDGTGAPSARPAAAESPLEAAPNEARASAPTLVNTDPPPADPAAAAAPAAVARGKTLIAGADGGLPDTMYFKKGKVDPEGGVSPRAPTVRDIPTAGVPAEERDVRSQGSGAVPAVAEPMDLDERKSSNTVLYVIAGAVAVAAAVGAFFAFT